MRLAGFGTRAMELLKMFRNTVSVKLAILTAALLLAACASDEPTAPEAPPAGPAGPAAPTVPGSTIVPGSLIDFQQNVGDQVFFDYDASTLDQTDRDTLGRQAAWLAQYPNVVLTIEGHADERGTREYNLALGARRAASVREYLVSLGVSAARLETISYGKERPTCVESAEGCWQQNRRGVSTIRGGAAS
jgi:peptidoglycan-associated lipoprotein